MKASGRLGLGALSLLLVLSSSAAAQTGYQMNEPNGTIEVALLPK